MRKKAHESVDRFWSRKPAMLRPVYRWGVYAWLRRLTGLPRKDCHISNFDVGMCEAVIDAVNQVEIGLMDGPSVPNNFSKSSGGLSKMRRKKKRQSYR